MRLFVLVSVIAATVAPVTVGASMSRGNQEKQFSIAQLGPDPFRVAPNSLETLVKDVPAAVIADIVGPGELKFEETIVPHATKPSVFGYATYRAIIRDVLFTRAQREAPPLTVGSQVEFRQGVGRESAEAFLARQIPVAPGEQCLLFLWLGPQGWQILGWHLQFRNSRTVLGGAEGLGKPSAITFLGPKWLGSAVPSASRGGIVMLDWGSLVGEVRRLGKQTKTP